MRSHPGPAGADPRRAGRERRPPRPQRPHAGAGAHVRRDGGEPPLRQGVRGCRAPALSCAGRVPGHAHGGAGGVHPAGALSGGQPQRAVPTGVVGPGAGGTHLHLAVRPVDGRAAGACAPLGAHAAGAATAGRRVGARPGGVCATRRRHAAGGPGRPGRGPAAARAACCGPRPVQPALPGHGRRPAGAGDRARHAAAGAWRAHDDPG